MTSENDAEAQVIAALRNLDVDYEVMQIDPDFADTAQFCEKYDIPLENSGNTIIVASRREPKQFCACIVNATRRLDVNKTVKRLMGVSRLSFASAEDTMELTGMMIGGVTAFALPTDLPVYIDHTLLGADYVILGSGSRSSKLKVLPGELGKIPNSEVIEGLSLEARPPA